jgi:hypothetical protein
MNVIYRLQGVEFEWDDQKAQRNVEKHGVSLKKQLRFSSTPSTNMGMQLHQPLMSNVILS